jgi:hypothetical protein
MPLETYVQSMVQGFQQTLGALDSRLETEYNQLCNEGGAIEKS